MKYFLVISIFGLSLTASAQMKVGDVYRGTDNKDETCEVTILKIVPEEELPGRSLYTVKTNYSDSELSVSEKIRLSGENNHKLGLDRDVLTGGFHDEYQGEWLTLYLGSDGQPNVAYYYNNDGLRLVSPKVRYCLDLELVKD